MEWSEYQRLASRTFNMEQARSERMENAALGLIGESGEIADIIKKHRHHGHTLDREKLIDECGDTLWYVAQANSGFDIDSLLETGTPEDYQDRNLGKASILLAAYCTDTALMLISPTTPQRAVKPYLNTIVFWVEGILAGVESSLDDAQQRNIEKLRKRYPDGFSHTASINRDPEAERMAWVQPGEEFYPTE